MPSIFLEVGDIAMKETEKMIREYWTLVYRTDVDLVLFIFFGIVCVIE